MDTLHSAVFYAFAAVTVGGGLVASFLGGRARALGIAALAVGLAGLLGDLDAGFAAVVTLVAFGASAVLLVRVRPAAGDEPANAARQAGAALAGGVFLLLAYAAFRGNWPPGYHAAGGVNTAALGRLLFGRDALAVEALAAALLVAAVATGLLARVRTR